MIALFILLNLFGLLVAWAIWLRHLSQRLHTDHTGEYLEALKTGRSYIADAIRTCCETNRIYAVSLLEQDLNQVQDAITKARGW